MSLVGRARYWVYHGCRAAGIEGMLKSSSWRARRLLILGYHGVSLEDEHAWLPALYITPERLRQRLQSIRAAGCTVLPLGEAVERLFAGTLPARAVALTFDDGMVDFAQRAWPVIQEFGYPVTLFWTTYYAGHPRPLPNLAWSYIPWKARGGRLEWPEVLAEPLLLDENGRARLTAAIENYVEKHRLDAAAKEALVEELAARLHFDYPELCAKRILQVMAGEEAAALAHAGVDLELHTHRHRLPADRERFEREIRDNRTHIRTAAGYDAPHFCYPSGWYEDAREDWMRELQITSAVTCDPALATPRSHPLFLPRFIDNMAVSQATFDAWLAGTPQWLPRRTYGKRQ